MCLYRFFFTPQSKSTFSLEPRSHRVMLHTYPRAPDRFQTQRHTRYDGIDAHRLRIYEITLLHVALSKNMYGPFCPDKYLQSVSITCPDLIQANPVLSLFLSLSSPHCRISTLSCGLEPFLHHLFFLVDAQDSPSRTVTPHLGPRQPTRPGGPAPTSRAGRPPSSRPPGASTRCPARPRRRAQGRAQGRAHRLVQRRAQRRC